jgi:DNA-binding GntR family transcriptional regulator
MSRQPRRRVQPHGEEFHRYLIKKVNHTRLLQVIEQIREQIRSVWTLWILAPRPVHGLIQEHQALKRSDVGRAERLMTTHVRRVGEAIFKLVH